MELEKFTKNFADQFEESDAFNIHSLTDFKSLETWDSLTSMSIQVMVEDDYGVKLSPDDIKAVLTVSDLFNLVKTRS